MADREMTEVAGAGGVSAAGELPWTRAELAGSPHEREDKAERVRAMFAAIARSYDLNNRLHSFGLDQLWRREAVRQAELGPGESALDVACGTGDLTEALARAGCEEVVGLDFTQEMLNLAEVKRERLDAGLGGRVRYLRGDAMALPFEDDAFDVLTIAFGIRNVQEPARAIGQFFRVLRPGGRLVILEFDRPGFAPVRWGNALYSGVIMPRTATLISRDRSGAYRYLPRSVQTFLGRREMERMLTDAGFESVSSRGLSLGICRVYRAVVPGPRGSAAGEPG